MNKSLLLVVLCLVALSFANESSSFDTLADAERFIKNHTKCVAIPCVYRVCTKYTVPKFANGCPKCPICEQKLSPCPLPACAMPAFCKRFEPTFFQFNGQKCQGCPSCADKSNNVESEIPPPLTANKPMPCPLFKCARPACEKTVPTTFNLNGNVCNGCPKCADPEQQQDQDKPVVSGCPHIKCAMPQCKQGETIVYGTLTFNGKPCKGCGKCVAKVAKVDEVRCPMPKCARPACEKTVPSTFQYRGKTCNGCPKCAKPEISGCPHIKCAMPQCKEGESIVYGTLNFNGKPCKGCGQCVGKADIVRCPMYKCARPACEKTEPTTFQFKGKTCNGCPRCVRK